MPWPSLLREPSHVVVHSYRCSPPTSLDSYEHAPRVENLLSLHPYGPSSLLLSPGHPHTNNIEYTLLHGLVAFYHMPLAALYAKLIEHKPTPHPGISSDY